MARLLEWFRNLLRRPEPGPAPDPEPWPVDEDLVASLNSIRGIKNLRPLVPHAALQRAAQDHADWMARTGRMVHDANGDLEGRMLRHGYPGLAAENIARAPVGVSAINMWHDSRPHYKNITGDYRDVGIASARSDNRDVFWCAVFGRT